MIPEETTSAISGPKVCPEQPGKRSELQDRGCCFIWFGKRLSNTLVCPLSSGGEMLPDGVKVIVCKDQIVHLSCPEGASINIRWATFGRRRWWGNHKCLQLQEQREFPSQSTTCNRSLSVSSRLKMRFAHAYVLVRPIVNNSDYFQLQR